MRCSLPVLILFLLPLPEAWSDDRIPAYLIRLPASVETAYVAATSAATFYRIDNHEHEGMRVADSVYMSIGENGDGKQRDGDRRTPLGIYFVTEQLDTTRYHEKYGPFAFPLDYPNTLDRQARRTGDGIWVHGVDARGGRRPPRDTDGCIALTNADLQALEKTFVPNTTPVIVAREIDWATAGQLDDIRSELETAVARWASSLQRGDLHAYLSLYGEDFRHWGMNKAEWTALTVQTYGERPIQGVAIDDLLLIGHPEQDGLYLSRFWLEITEAGSKVASTKRLYWRKTAGGSLRIIAEDAG